jgi:membrane-bound lytic murein transglycosylase D
LRRETAAYVPKFLAVASILRYPGRNGIPASWEAAPAWETVSPGRPVDILILAERAGVGADLLKSANAELRYTVTPPAADYRLKVPAQSASLLKAVLADTSSPLVRYAIHTVRSGDTLSAISRRYGSPIATIRQSNPGLAPDRIRLGQKLVIPLLKDGPAPLVEVAAEEPPAFSGSYVVARGDTLWALSLRFEVQPELLAERNGLSLDSVIREGTVLRVPIDK